MPGTPVETNRRLREMLRLSRKRAKLSQAAAGSQAQISGVWWRRIETGAQPTVRADVLARMSHAAGISPSLLRELGYGHVANLAEGLAQLAAADGNGASSAEEYLRGTPVDERTREALVRYLRWHLADQAMDRGEPLEDDLLRRRHQ